MFNEAVITMDGLELDAKIRAGQTVATFTHVKLGDGIYTGTEDLSVVTDMKSVRQTFGISSILVTDNKTVRLRTVSDNVGIDEGYLISEIGIFSQDPDKGEILYSIALGVDSKMDYQPSESELPGATSTFDTYVSVSNVEAATIITGCGAAASAEDVEEIKYPQFDDSGEVEDIENFPSFYEKIKSKMNIFEFFKNLKAGMKFVLHTGQIVNNCVSDNAELPLSAMQGKVLMDLINQTNGNLGTQILDSNILQKARELPIGFFVYNLSSLYTYTDLPSDGYTYGVVSIYKRSDNSIMILLQGEGADTPLTSNCYNGVSWTGWRTYITNNDFDANNDEYLAALKQQWDNLSITDDFTKPGYAQIWTSGPHVMALYYKHSNGIFGWAIICSYVMPKPIFARITNGTWGNAYYL